MADPFFLHIDLDAFFASVEQRDDPSLRGKPVIIGGLPCERRSVVSTASYEARKYGVHSAMSIPEAYKRCPNGIYLRGRMERYLEVSNTIMNIFRSYSPVVDQLSIDEACIDLTGTSLLFGKESDTALKLKKEVREKTGLTVSCGLASTKYIAKLASEIHKPDGFFEVRQGFEKDFMLSLPLEKIWGLGPKTLARIRASGIHSTKDIFNKSKNLLVTLFGNSTGTFLYDVVRGNKIDTFARASNNHSISAETTFPYDLTDLYAAETCLMNLCHTIMFRMHNENVTSKTVFVKIRYDDFTTVSAQETFPFNINSIDELYEKAKKLFEKKYDISRSIRLLGLGVEKLRDSNKAKQEELFDFTETKQNKVEKTIVSISKKHPDVKIQKARLLKKIEMIIFALLISSFVKKGNLLFAQTNIESSGAASIITENIYAEEDALNTSESIFNFSLGKADVEFFAKGYWNAELVQSSIMTFGYGNSFAFSFGIPVFKQKVDLQLMLTLNKNYFFKAEFADVFKKNTIALGYEGSGIIRNVLVSNRDIIFPDIYSSKEFKKSIRGGNNQSPGASIHLQGKKWRSDALIRYDMLQEKSATFYGKNQVTNSLLAISEYVKDSFFTLPSSVDISSIENIFIESSDGNYLDNNGHSYRILNSSEYLLLPARFLIVISPQKEVEKNPRILLTFRNRNKAALEQELGNFSDIPTDDLENFFLARVKKYFNDADKNIDIEQFSFAKNVSDFFTKINSHDALIINSSDGFSPFACNYRYKSPVLDVQNVNIIFEKSEVEVQGYRVALVEDDISFIKDDFFSLDYLYADIHKNENLKNDVRLPSVRYPLAEINPSYYLGYKDTSDIFLSFNTYNSVSRFEIGQNVSASSIVVYKNGVVDRNARYDESSGCVTLSSEVKDTDHIYITWYEDSQTFLEGSISSAIAFVYDFLPNLSLDLSFLSNWAVGTKNKYASANSAKNGYVSFTSGINYEQSGFSLFNASMISLENQNVTGLYRIIDVENPSEQSVYLSQKSVHSLPKNFSPVLTNRDGGVKQELKEVDNKTKNVIAYQKEQNVSGYTFPLEWNFSNIDEFVGASIIINNGAELLNAKTFSIGIKSEEDLSSDIEIYLQLGVDSSEDFKSINESYGKIPTWKISALNSSAPLSQDVHKAFYLNRENADSNGWQVVSVALSDYDRSRMIKYNDARIIVLNKMDSSNSGKIILGPYEIGNENIITHSSKEISVSISTTEEMSSSIKQFSSSTNYAQNIRWQNNATSVQEYDKRKIYIAKYFDQVDISSYKTLNMIFKYSVQNEFSSVSDDEDAFIFTLDSDATSIEKDGKLALHFSISKDKWKNYKDNKWHTLCVNLKGRQVFIDGQNVSLASVNSSVIPTRLRLCIDTAIDGSAYKLGTFSFDELYLEGNNVRGNFSNITRVQYKKGGVLAKTKNDFVILEDINAEASVKESVYFSTNGKENFSVTGDINFDLKFVGTQINASTVFSSGEDNVLTNAQYLIESVEPYFSVVSFEDSFRYDYFTSSFEYSDFFSLDFSSLKVPLSLSLKTQSQKINSLNNQKTDAKIQSTFSKNNWELDFRLNSFFSQKIKNEGGTNENINKNAFSSYADAVKLAYSYGKQHAMQRLQTNEFYFATKIPWSSFEPVITFKILGDYNDNVFRQFKDSLSFTTLFPFKINDNTISIKWEKHGGGSTLENNARNYFSDFKNIFLKWKNRSWFFYAFPLYDLISSKLAMAVQNDTDFYSKSSDSLHYTSSYNVSWNRSLSQSLIDFFVPNSAQLTLERDIRTGENTSDIYQIKTSVSTNAFNIFGRESVLSSFKWFELDEYFTSITGSIKIPRNIPKEFTWAFSIYSQQGFYINDFDKLETGFEFSFETNGDWNFQTSAVWKRKGKFSPIVSLIPYIWKKYDKKLADITRSHSIDIQLFRKDKEFSHNYSIVNSSNIQAFTHIAFTSSQGITFECTQNSIMRLLLNLSFSVKLTF